MRSNLHAGEQSAANADISRIKSASARFSINSNSAIFSSVIAALSGYGLQCRNRSLAGFERDDPLEDSATKGWTGPSKQSATREIWPRLARKEEQSEEGLAKTCPAHGHWCWANY
jgi:hypothetical protein